MKIHNKIMRSPAATPAKKSRSLKTARSKFQSKSYGRKFGKTHDPRVEAVIPNKRRVPSRACKTSTVEAAATFVARAAGERNPNGKDVDSGGRNEPPTGDEETPISVLTSPNGGCAIKGNSVDGISLQDDIGGEKDATEEVSSRRTRLKYSSSVNEDFHLEAYCGGKSSKTVEKKSSSESTNEKPKNNDSAIEVTETSEGVNTPKTSSTVASTASDFSASANSGDTKHSNEQTINEPRLESNHPLKSAKKRLIYEMRRSADEDNKENRGKIIDVNNGHVSSGNDSNAEFHDEDGRARKVSKISRDFVKSNDAIHSAETAKSIDRVTNCTNNVGGKKVDRASKNEKNCSRYRASGDAKTYTSKSSSEATKSSRPYTSNSKHHSNSPTPDRMSGRPQDYKQQSMEETKRPSSPPSNSTAPSFKLPSGTITIRTKPSGRNSSRRLKIGTNTHANKNENVCIPGFLTMKQLYEIAKDHGGMAIQYRALYHQGDAGPIVDKNFDTRRSASKKSDSHENAKDGQSRFIKKGTLIIQSYYVNEKGNRGGSNFSFDHWKLPGQVKRGASIYDSTRPVLAEKGYDHSFFSFKTRNGSASFRPFLALDPSLSSRDVKRVKTFVEEAKSGDTPVKFFAEKGKVVVAIGNLGEVKPDIFEDFDSVEEIREKEIPTRVRREHKNVASTPKRPYTSEFLSSYEKARTKSARRKRKFDQRTDLCRKVYFDIPDVDAKFRDPKYFGLIECLGGGCEEIGKETDLPHRGRLLELPGEILPGRWEATIVHDAQYPSNRFITNGSGNDDKALGCIRISMRQTSSSIASLEQYYSEEHSIPIKHCTSVSVIRPHKNRLKSFIDQGIFSEDEVSCHVEGEERILNDSFLSGISLVSFVGFTSASEAINLANKTSSEFLRGITPSSSYYGGEKLLAISKAENGDIGNAVIEGILYPCKIGFDEEYFVVASQDEESRVAGIDVILSLNPSSYQQNRTLSIETNEFQWIKEDFILTEANVEKHLEVVGYGTDEVMDRFQAQRLHLAAIPTGFNSDEMNEGMKSCLTKSLRLEADFENGELLDERDCDCFEDHGASSSGAGPHDIASALVHENTNVVIPSQIALSNEKPLRYIERDQSLNKATGIGDSNGQNNVEDEKSARLKTDNTGRLAFNKSSSLLVTCSGLLGCDVRQEPDRKAYFTPDVETLETEMKAAVNATAALHPFKLDVVVPTVDTTVNKIDNTFTNFSQDNHGKSKPRPARSQLSSRRITTHPRDDWNFQTKQDLLKNTMESSNSQTVVPSQRLHFDHSISFGSSTENQSSLFTKPSAPRLYSAQSSSPWRQVLSDNSGFRTDPSDANAPKSDKKMPRGKFGMHHVNHTLGKTSNVGTYLATSQHEDEVYCDGDSKNHVTHTNPANHRTSNCVKKALSKTSQDTTNLDFKFDTEHRRSKPPHSSMKSSAAVLSHSANDISSTSIDKSNQDKDPFSGSGTNIVQRSQNKLSGLYALPTINPASISENRHSMARSHSKVGKRFMGSQLSRNNSNMVSSKIKSSSTTRSKSTKHTPTKKPIVTVSIDDPFDDSDYLFGCRIKSSEKKPGSARSKSTTMAKLSNVQKTVESVPDASISSTPNVAHQCQRTASKETMPNSLEENGNDILPENSHINTLSSQRNPRSYDIAPLTIENSSASCSEQKSTDNCIGLKSLYKDITSTESDTVSSLSAVYHQPLHDVYYGGDCEVYTLEADFPESQSYASISNEPYFHDYYYGLFQCCAEEKSTKQKNIIDRPPMRSTLRPKLFVRHIILIGAVLLANFIPHTKIDLFQPKPRESHMMNAFSVFECCRYSFEEAIHSQNEVNEKIGWFGKLYG